MGYEQLSTVIVLIIVLIGVVVWLPIRTSNSMRHVEEHRDDRYSTSLHLVDEHSGTRFSDDTTFAKGVQMQPSERRASKLTPERIAEVRRLRHAAVRRRQMIVAALLVITVVVLVLAITLHFSTLFALIPAALTAVVLALGAHAASQARAWERKVAEAKARERKSKAARAKARKAAQAQAAQAQAAQVGSSPRGESAGDAAPTDEMTSLEIRRALRQAQIEQKRALAERARKIAEAQARVEAEQARLAAAQAEAEARAAAQAQAVAQAQAAQVAQAAQDQQTSAAPTASPESSAPHTQSAPNVGAPVMVAPQQAVSGATGSPVVSKNTSKTKDAAASQSDASDHTTELAEVHPARALDAYDMATSQDLISFSLGEARNVEAEPVAPESREIKSMRQVAKAEPVDAERERELAEEAKVETAPAQQADAHVKHEGQQPAEETQSAEPVAETNGVGATESDAGMSDVEAFHESEEQAKVAVPAATSDSLGNNLAAILARRGA
ncbi:hypothetical protein [Bifidobacterium callitrichos]|nr:hypothetical protein [Bifidobacterium callitrichos]